MPFSCRAHLLTQSPFCLQAIITDGGPNVASEWMHFNPGQAHKGPIMTSIYPEETTTLAALQTLASMELAVGNLDTAGMAQTIVALGVLRTATPWLNAASSPILRTRNVRSMCAARNTDSVGPQQTFAVGSVKAIATNIPNLPIPKALKMSVNG
jgi:hypothetical protein